MVVQVNKLNGMAALKKLGVSGEALSQLLAAGVQVKLTAQSLHLTASDGIDISLPVAFSDLQALNAGTLLKSKKTLLLAAVTKAIEKSVGDPGSGMALLPTKLPAVEKPPVEIPYEPVTVAQMKLMPLVKLSDADRMYQPVEGTSPSSRYFLVAASSDLRVAARYKNDKLSIRIEGPGLHKITSILELNGLSAGSAEHFSTHFSVADANLAAKALGAVLVGLGVPFETPMPTFKRLLLGG